MELSQSHGKDLSVSQSDRPGYGLYNDRGKTPPYLPQMIVRNAAFQSRTGAQKQTRGAGPQLLLHLPSLGTPTPTPPFPVPSNLTPLRCKPLLIIAGFYHSRPSSGYPF